MDYFNLSTSRYTLYLAAGAAGLGLLLSLYPTQTSLTPKGPSVGPSPEKAVLRLSQDQQKDLPYPPNALPGSRNVASPYGSTRVYEWGPAHGPKVLLVHGISTPSIALGGLAHALVEKGCRVMLFDLFGRGYSSSPDATVYRYDSALYASQILIALQSSPLPWVTSRFSLIGYSLGGAIAADFASYFPSILDSVILIAPGGLIRTTHISWKSRLLYSSGGLLPEWLIERLVTKRLWSGPQTARDIEPEPDLTDEEGNKIGGLRNKAVYFSSQLGLLPGNPNSTVGNVVDWQIEHHKGFVPAFISSIRHAPIHEQHHRWRVLAGHLRAERQEDISSHMEVSTGPRLNEEVKTSHLKKVLVILGEKDPIIIAEEVAEDATSILGEDSINVHVVKGAGHEVAIDSVEEIVGVIGRYWTASKIA